MHDVGAETYNQISLGRRKETAGYGEPWGDALRIP